MKYEERLIEAIEQLGFGSKDTPGPGGLEGLTVALAGDPNQLESIPNPLGNAIRDLAGEVSRLADAHEDLASACQEIAGKMK